MWMCRTCSWLWGSLHPLLTSLPYSYPAGKDHRGGMHRVAFYSDDVPAGLKLGAVMRWRNPHFHWFMDGSSGARIEDEDLPNISIVHG